MIGRSGWWGKHATDEHNVFTGNPVADGDNLWFADGPYARGDARLARPTTSACLKEGPARDDPRQVTMAIGLSAEYCCAAPSGRYGRPRRRALPALLPNAH